MEVLRRNVELVEVVGLDEAYLDLTGLFSPKATMRRIATEIKADTGLTCSVGVSESRMLAKITSELGKPAGLVVLSRGQALERFAGHSPGLIPGIGPKTVSRLEEMGIRTLADLRGWQRPALEDRFGPRSGAWLHARGNLLDETPVVSEHETKSQSTEITFDVDVRQRDELERHLAELSEELCRRLRKRELEGRTIGIKIRLDDWTNVTRSQTIEEPTNDPAFVGRIALDLLRAYDPQRPVRLLGVRLASFETDAAAEREPTPGQLQLGLAS
jgi:DNA polymerase-4